MEHKKSEMWRRHQMAVVERMQKDLARYTHLVIRAMGLYAVVYLASWVAILMPGPDGVSTPVALVAGLSAMVVALGAPAFALAVGVERYLRGRLNGPHN